MCDVVYLFGSLNRGGAETLMLDVFKNASKAAFSFTGIYRKGGALESSFKNSGVLFEKFAPKFPFDPIYLYKLRRHVVSKEAKIVHAQQYIDAIYAKIALRGTNIKIVQTYHGYDYGRTMIGDLFIKLISKHIDCNIFVSSTQRDYFIKCLNLPLEKTTVVYNGINFAKLGIVKKRIPHDGKIIMGTVGNFVIGRDPMTLCRFLKRLDEDNIPFEFYFVGRRDNRSPHYYDDCVSFCESSGLNDKVHFLGGRNDVPELLAGWDVFMYSTDHDTFGIAVVEAIALGMPVFVNDWYVMREITDNGRLAVLYKSKNVDDLYEKFMDYIFNKEKYVDCAVHNADIIRTKFGIGRHVDCLNDLYAQLTDVK